MPQKMKLKELEIENSGLNSYGKGKFTGNDIEIADANRGLILTAPNLTKWLFWTDNNGTTFTTQVAASPEITFAERETKIKTQQSEYQKLKTQLSLIASTDLKRRIDVLEQIIKLILK